MKKLVVLMLVVGMASLASAQLSLSVTGIGITNTGGDNYDIDVGASGTLSISWDEDVTGWDAFVGIGDVGDGGNDTLRDHAKASLGAPLDTNGGNASYVMNTSYTTYYMWALGAGDTAGNMLAGVHYTLALSALGSEDDVFIIGLADAWDQTNANLAAKLTFTIVPEPMTMALLGLGGLFLRRKK